MLATCMSLNVASMQIRVDQINSILLLLLLLLQLGGCPFNGPLSVMKYPTRENPRRYAASPIKYNELRVPQHSSIAEQQPLGR